MLNSKISNEEYLVSLLDINDTKVLDFGSGGGDLVKKLHDANFDAVGCDILKWYKTREGDQVNGLVVGKDLIGSSDNRIPFDDEYFSSIVSNQVIEHILDLDTMASEINRVLIRSGRVYLIFPVKEALLEPHTKIPLLHLFDPKSLIFTLAILIKTFIEHRFLHRGSRVSLAKKIQATRVYFQDQVHFRKLNDVKKTFESSGFEVIDETSKWFMARYSNSWILRLASFFMKPKYFIGCHLILRKIR